VVAAGFRSRPAFPDAAPSVPEQVAMVIVFSTAGSSITDRPWKLDTPRAVVSNKRQPGRPSPVAARNFSGG